MAFKFLLSKMVKSKINDIRHTIRSMQKRKTIMPEISQLLNNRLIVPTICKREDYKRSKHDAVFSPWRILIESYNWKDFKNGKEGVRSRYRVQNLPRKYCTGIYELGVAVIGQDQSRRKLDRDNVLPAYVGKSVNVRSRIQHYGRCGGHFPPGLFVDIISKFGGAIVYRWVPMGLKREAEEEEGRILRTFDYAWNICSNGERRHLDLLKKLCDSEFMSKRKSGILQVLFPFLANQVSIGIKQERKLSFDVDVDEEKKSNHFFTSVLKLIRSRLQLVSDRFDGCCSDSVCGVILEKHVKDEKSDSDTNIIEEEGSTRFCEATTKKDFPCTRRSPDEGSKRCWQHKEETSGDA